MPRRQKYAELSGSRTKPVTLWGVGVVESTGTRSSQNAFNMIFGIFKVAGSVNGAAFKKKPKTFLT